MTRNKRGAFIVIEGLDRSGKSTQISAILSRLEYHGVTAKVLKFPDRTTPIGKMIDSYLKSQSDLDDRAIHLLFSANRWELATSITTHLQNGTLLLCDRYAFSGTAFSAAKGLPYDWCCASDVALPAPDLTLFLDIPPEHARLRAGFGEERYENEEMQKRVRDVFARIGREIMGGRQQEFQEHWLTIDASRPVEFVTDVIWNAIVPLLDGTLEPLAQLWLDG
ncbi:hypothetical protein AMATHDRAFT_138094 [Amanita thiersii Skay4041]|uniref:Thymidylate kinase n=1 Tax=Amanita thiersii Skay4041 TaxID=703135 RepID=A0A2A9NQH5_9AGAR|nr:hypothetical protein AMATHDRAFT_138094 [Amanita thiersii Skay4041]